MNVYVCVYIGDELRAFWMWYIELDVLYNRMYLTCDIIYMYVMYTCSLHSFCLKFFPQFAICDYHSLFLRPSFFPLSFSLPLFPLSLSLFPSFFSLSLSSPPLFLSFCGCIQIKQTQIFHSLLLDEDSSVYVCVSV